MNSIHPRSWAGLLLAVCLMPGCQPPASDVGRATDAGRTDAATGFEEAKSLFAAIRDADQVTWYEGLPHQFFDRKSLEEEKKQKPTVTLHGFPFYAATLDIGAEDAAKLKGLLEDERSFAKWSGHKRCGGFHPDYLAEYRVEKSAYRFLICLGCNEVKVYGPDRSLHCDVRAAGELQVLLMKYRENRPVRTKP